MFEFEPPPSALNGIPEADNATINAASENASVKGDTTTRPQLKRTHTAKRKDSMAAITGITEHLSEFLHDHSAENLMTRLDALEASTKRIEVMIQRIGQDMGEDDSESGNEPHARRPEDFPSFEETENS